MSSNWFTRAFKALDEVEADRIAYELMLNTLRAELAAAIAERDRFAKHCGAYKAEAEKWESLYDDCEDALVGEQSRDNFGHGESIADCARRVIRERDQSRWTLRGIAQQLIEQIGSAGPEDAIDAARRACGVIESMATRLAAIDNAPTMASIEGGEGFRYLSWDQLPQVGSELIARPAKEAPPMTRSNFIRGEICGCQTRPTHYVGEIDCPRHKRGNGQPKEAT